MKKVYLFLFVLILSFHFSPLCFGQNERVLNYNVERTSIELKEGINRIRINDRNKTVIVLVRSNKIKSIEIEENRKKFSLIQARIPEKQTDYDDCKCGISCWESEELKMSICVCKNCNGNGSGGESWLDTYTFASG